MSDNDKGITLLSRPIKEPVTGGTVPSVEVNIPVKSPGKVVAVVMSTGDIWDMEKLGNYVVKGYSLKEYINESKAIQDIPTATYELYNLAAPPYSPDKLALTLKANTFHYRCVKQKASDVAGLGWFLNEVETWRELGISEMVHKENNKRLEYFFENCNKRMTLREMLDCIWVDYEAIGGGYMEAGRGDKGIPTYLGHMPSVEMRIDKTGLKYAQMVQTQVRWFKLFGIEDQINMTTGEWGKASNKERGNEIIPFLAYNPTSRYYGVPDHIPAISAITGALAAAEFNLDFFVHNAVPQLAIVVEGGEFDSETKGVVTEYFREGIQGRAHKTLILSTKPDTFGNIPKIHFERLAVEIRDASFRLYRQDLRDEVLTAHGVPPYRIGLAIVGSLGGNVSREATEVYKNSIIEPRQEILEHRINNFIVVDGFKIRDWKLKFKDIDVRDRYMESRIIRNLMGWGGIPVLTINDARKRVEEAPVAGGEKIWVSKNVAPIDMASNAPVNPKEQASTTPTTPEVPTLPEPQQAFGLVMNGMPLGKIWTEKSKLRFQTTDSELRNELHSLQMKGKSIADVADYLIEKGFEVNE